VPVNLTKASGSGKMNGRYGLEEYLVLKTVTITDPVAHMKILSGTIDA
jgi:acyl-CoA reductase-like NAD-dependent aldehyde dehydrogenase